MGNKESQLLSASCGSASDADFLDSSTDSSYVSSYLTLHLRQHQQQQQQQPQQQKKTSTAAAKPLPHLPKLRFSRSSSSSGSPANNSGEVTPRSSLQLPPDSPVPGGNLCSVLNHHHEAAEVGESDSASTVPPRCACRRSLSTGTGDQQSLHNREAPLLSPQRPRILPIVRNGRQLSEDIYWVLPPRRKQQQLDGQRLSTSSASEHCCEPASFCGPGCSPLELVQRVTSEVFGVTDEESYLALSLHHWDTERAAKYLKVEQLFRLGVCDRSRCHRLLEMHNWKLDSVIQQLACQRLCRSESH